MRQVPVHAATFLSTGKAEEWGAGASTRTCWVHCCYHLVFGGLVPSFSKHLWAALEKGDEQKFLGLARDDVRVSYPTRNFSFIFNPLYCALLGRTFQLPQLKGCGVPWVLPLFLPPTLLLWALPPFSSPMPVMSNFAKFSPLLLLLHIHTVTVPFPHGNSILARATVTISTVFWSPVGKMGSLHARTRAQSIIMQVSAGAILFQFASLQGPRICSLIILNEVVSQLESAFSKILLHLMILFVNFK